MSDKLDRFTKYARSSLFQARDAALQFRQHQIAPQHLLLGISGIEDSIATVVLKGFHTSYIQLFGRMVRMPSRGDNAQGNRPELGDATKYVIEYSVDEARKMGCYRITTGHILLGLLCLKRGVAHDLLQFYSVTLEEARKLTLQAIQQQAPAEAREALLPDSENGDEEIGDEGTGDEEP